MLHSYIAVSLSSLFLLFSLPTFGKEAQTLGKASYRYQAGRLVVSTGKVRREWLWTGAGFRTTSYKNLLTNKEWAGSDTDYRCDWQLPGKITSQSDAQLLSVDCIETDDAAFTSRHLLVTAQIEYDCGLRVEYLIRVYPDAKGLWTALSVMALDSFSSDGVPEDLSDTERFGARQPVKIARCEFLPIDFATKNVRRYWGFYNDPGHRVNTKDMVREEVKRGWPLFKDEQVTWASGISVESGGEGFIVVKESNKTVNKYGHQTGAFYCTTQGLEVTGWGLKPSEITGDARRTWATWTLLFKGGDDQRQLALKQFDRRRFPVNLDSDMHIVLDTWGSDWQHGEDDRIYGRENSAFPVVEQEIKSAAELGIDIVRIDDGWQSGETKSRGSWHPNPEVGYDPHWKKTKALSEKYGVRIGLWAAVRFITQEELLRNQSELGVATWKFDFDRLQDWQSFHQRLDQTRAFIQETNYSTQVSWCPEYDDQRYGWYSPIRECGPMYFQNIQNNLPRHLIYVPYISLRHHWMIAKFYNLNDLQCHWPNPARTNPAYSDAHLHSQSYAAMTAFAGSPSCYMLTQLLKSEERAELKKTISVYKQHRRDMYKSYVFPIGDEPSNDSWTGFQVYHPDRKMGHLIVFRELHNQKASHSLALKFLPDRELQIHDLMHSQKTWNTSTDKSGRIQLHISSPADYRFLKYEDLGPKSNASL